MRRADGSASFVGVGALGILVRKFEETYRPSRMASERPEFVRLGLTDATLLGLADHSSVLLTTDVGLYLATLKSGHDALNFNHYRCL